MKSKGASRSKAWLPEHVQIAIERALLEFPDRSSMQAHRTAIQIVRKMYPALPMNEQELLAAVQQLARET